MAQSFVFLKIFADLLLNLGQFVILVLIVQIFIFIALIIFIIVTFILFGFCDLVRGLRFGRRGVLSRGRCLECGTEI
jgi:hypothetical protein